MPESCPACGTVPQCDCARWRSVETLPEIAERVLVYAPNSRRPVQEAERLIEYEGAARWYWSTPHGASGRGYVILAEAVTKWMPLPDPPPVIR